MGTSISSRHSQSGFEAEEERAATADSMWVELSPEFWSGKFWSGGPKFSVENWSGRTDFFGKNGPPLENWSE